jgi:hypothetical protein
MGEGDLKNVHILIGKVRLCAELRDTCERFGPIPKFYFKSANVAIIVFDISSNSSSTKIQNPLRVWIIGLRE